MSALFDIELKVPGTPTALKRHRTVRVGKFNKNYDPSEGDKADFLVKAIELKPNIPFDEPLYVQFEFCFKRPKSHFRSGSKSHMLKESAPHWHTGRPDIDNLIKFVADALNEVFWRDDTLICYTNAKKIYGDQPYVQVQVSKINRFN